LRSLLVALLFLVVPGASVRAGTEADPTLERYGFAQYAPIHGVRAVIAPLLLEAKGDRSQAAAWIGIGDYRARIDGCPLWLRVGVARISGARPFLYMEWNKGRNCRLRDLGFEREYDLAIVERPGAAGVWEVWVDNRMEKAILLPDSSGRVNASVIVESRFGGEARARFRRLETLRRPTDWRPMRRQHVFQAGTYRPSRSWRDGWEGGARP
jgi:hypothetical protein